MGGKVVVIVICWEERAESVLAGVALLYYDYFESFDC